MSIGSDVHTCTAHVYVCVGLLTFLLVTNRSTRSGTIFDSAEILINLIRKTND